MPDKPAADTDKPRFRDMNADEKRRHILRRAPVWLGKAFLAYVAFVVLMLLGAGVVAWGTGNWDEFWAMLMSV